MTNNELAGKICMVTGATAGIGEAAALMLSKKGAVVVGVGRNPVKIENSLAMIKKESGNDDVHFLKADLSSQAEIRALAEEFKKKFDRLDVLVNNAGATFAERQETVDGIEMTFALNHLGYFLLTNLLLDTLKKSAPARIINVASSLHKLGKLDFDDIPFNNGYSRGKAYQRTKLANIAFSYELARRVSNLEVTVNAMNPGLVKTNVGNAAGGIAARLKNIVDDIAGITPEEGAATIIYMASSPEVEGVSGKYFVKEKSIPTSKISYDLAFGKRLWDISEELVELKFS